LVWHKLPCSCIARFFKRPKIASKGTLDLGVLDGADAGEHKMETYLLAWVKEGRSRHTSRRRHKSSHCPLSSHSLFSPSLSARLLSFLSPLAVPLSRR
jgi:hypothetical protein